MKNRTAFILSSLLCLVLAGAEAVAAQEPVAPQPPAPTRPTPSPTPSGPGTDTQPATASEGVPAGSYIIISGIEVGLRAASVEGNHDKYRSDLNYQPGFRIFDSSFLVRAKNGDGPLFNTLLVNSSGFGADPQGSLRVNVEKGRWYRFNANFRRVAYDNRLLNLALGEHTMKTKHKFGDFDLRLLPLNRNFRFTLGYSMDRNSGPGTTTYDAIRDEFPILSRVKTRADEYRVGVEARVGGLDLGFLQGVRYYRDDSTYFVGGPNAGNNLTNTSVLNTLQRDVPTRGRTLYTRASAHTLIQKRVDILARYTYSKSRTRFALAETFTGRNQSGNTIERDVSAFEGETERPNHLADFGVTWLVNDKLRISDTFRANTFRNDGGHIYNELAFLRRPNGTIITPFPTVTSVPIERILEYRRFHNQIKVDYQFGPRLSMHFGHRITDRSIKITGTGAILPSPSETNEFDDVTDTRSNSFFGGFKARPVKIWNVYFDFERGEADNVFTRVDNYNAINFRVRNRITPSPKLNINLSFISKDNTNPGLDVRDQTIFGELRSGVQDIAATPFSVEISSRVFSGSVDWSPNYRYTLSAGYTRTSIESDAQIIFFLNNPPSPQLPDPRAGRSLYFMKDNYFFLNANVQMHPRLAAFASYRVHKDTGQGDRPSQPDPLTFVRSYPIRFQSPEVRLIFRVNRRLDWNVGYQYYDYLERFRDVQTYPSQNYHAHLPYTSLRFYIGGGER